METFKAAVRFTVLSFVLVAGGITFMGLAPDARVEAEALTTEEVATETQLSDSNKTDKLITAGLGKTG